MKKFLGKYRGVVTNNLDSEQRGRIQAEVPDVLGRKVSKWALPCVPYAGENVGLFLPPPLKASVWIEFENGDPNLPIWSGCFWGAGSLPAPSGAGPKKVLKTESATITLDDTPGTGGLVLETTDGQRISLRAEGIVIENGRGAVIRLIGPTMSVNGGALEVI